MSWILLSTPFGIHEVRDPSYIQCLDNSRNYCMYSNLLKTTGIYTYIPFKLERLIIVDNLQCLSNNKHKLVLVILEFRILYFMTDFKFLRYSRFLGYSHQGRRLRTWSSHRATTNSRARTLIDNNNNNSQQSTITQPHYHSNIL